MLDVDASIGLEFMVLGAVGEWIPGNVGLQGWDACVICLLNYNVSVKMSSDVNINSTAN